MKQYQSHLVGMHAFLICENEHYIREHGVVDHKAHIICLSNRHEKIDDHHL